MEIFVQSVDGWHEFYMLFGTIAATLMGLLFVTLSLNADMIIRKENADLRLLAAQTFTDFIMVVMYSAIFLIPHQGPHGLGFPLLGIDCIGLYATGRRYFEARRNRPRVWGKSKLAMRFALPIICFFTVMIIAIAVSFGMASGLYWLVPVMILLIWDASLNAWDLLLRLREPAPES